MIERYCENARRFAEKPALQLSSDESLLPFSYADVFASARRIACLLACRTVAAEPVAILMNYDPYWVMVFLGIYFSGRCTVPLDIQLSPDEASNLLRHSGAGLVFVDAANREKLAGLDLRLVDPHETGLFPAPKPAPGRGPDPGTPTEKTDSLAGKQGEPGPRKVSEAPHQGPDTPPARHDPSVPLLIIYTSGTTGDPKGVVLSEANFRAEINGLLELLPVGPDDHLLSVLPLHHVLALLTSVLAPLYIGATVTFLSTVERARVLRALQQLGVSVFVCVPQFFYLFHAHVGAEIARKPYLIRKTIALLMRMNFSLRRHGMNLGKFLFPQIHRAMGSRFRFFAAGGSYFDPAVIRDLAAWGIDIIQAYGLTETSGACTATPLLDQRWGSVGRPLPGVEMTVLRPNQDGQGEIAVRGPIVTSGYYRNEQATQDAFQDGWFLSGDLGYRDAGGFYTITGRLKEVIVLSSGKNVYPEELERHYSRHPSIKEIAIVARISAAGEEQLHAIVVPDFEYLRARKVTSSLEVIRFEIESLGSQLPAYKRVTGLQLRTDPLPRTTTRKLKRHELQEQMERSGKRAAAPAAFDNRAVEETWRFLVRLGKTPESLASDCNLELDFGLDSLQRVELLSHLEEVFNRPVSQEEASQIYTLGDLVALFDPETAVLRAIGKESQGWAKLLSADEPFAEPFLRRRPVSHLCVGLLRLFFRYCIARPFFKMTVEGLENLPPKGPYMICPNHLSYLDGLFFVGGFPRAVFDQVFFLGYSEYFQAGFSRMFAQWIHIVPLDPDAYLVRALRAGAMGLRRGRILCIFPEGSRSIDGEVKPFRQGAAILAREANVAIVPAAIVGTYEVWPRHGSRIRCHPVKMVFGAPIQPGDYPSASSHTLAVQRAVQELVARARQKPDAKSSRR